jgi:hypothetical protein
MNPKHHKKFFEIEDIVAKNLNLINTAPPEVLEISSTGGSDGGLPTPSPYLARVNEKFEKSDSDEEAKGEDSQPKDVDIVINDQFENDHDKLDDYYFNEREMYDFDKKHLGFDPFAMNSNEIPNYPGIQPRLFETKKQEEMQLPKISLCLDTHSRRKSNG